ncbi:hypothetical protein NDU88_010858 [Pleurodeles waltl]|uniref:Transposase DDE domain-containing protein n=1 Tax=Pleurodeles waltl TaxID=8319 RepID=A0AAV7PZ85_PLEWA|nr:hypothetical protein NDU88_010858 [Pleurodeles waltl]
MRPPRARHFASIGHSWRAAPARREAVPSQTGAFTTRGKRRHLKRRIRRTLDLVNGVCDVSDWNFRRPLGSYMRELVCM